MLSEVTLIRQAKLFRGDIDIDDLFTLSQPLHQGQMYRRRQALKKERKANRF